ncbi:MAG: hypothetical protein QOG10_6699 [Kribbellaceae bacterium]|nr:hypothetical protein [Kribbellaceae bacterium]
MTDPHQAVQTDTGRTDLAARYGRPNRAHKALVVGIVGVLALTGLVWLLWVAYVQSNPPVASRLQAFKITSPTTATATILVERTKDVEASCRLQAKAADYSIVGEVTLTVPANSPRSQTLGATVTTQRDATSVVLVGCTTADSHRPH